MRLRLLPTLLHAAQASQGVHRVARVQISDGRPSAALVQGLGGTRISCSNEGTVTLDEEAVAAAGVLLLQPLQESLCRTQVATPEVSERLVVQRLGSARAATTVLATHEVRSSFRGS